MALPSATRAVAATTGGSRPAAADGTAPGPRAAQTFQNTESVDATGDRRIDGIIYSECWMGGAVSYSDPNAAADYEEGYSADTNRNGIQAPSEGMARLRSDQLTAVQTVLDTAPLGQPEAYAGFSVEGFTDLDVSYAGGGSGRGTIRLANSTDPASNTAYSYFPAPFGEGGDVWFEGSGDRPRAGNYDQLAIIHELGHALGLKHGHEDIVFEPQPTSVDALEFTVMSYRGFVGDDLTGYDLEAWSFPQSYMTFDIAALQHLYGADFETRAGDTIYAWDPDTGETLVDGEVAIAPGGNRIFLTVWDGGGTDGYDLSPYSTGVSIDLAPGEHSAFAWAQLADLGGGPHGGRAGGNVYNALRFHGDPRSLIENATGGTGDDTIRGNAAANLLKAGRGSDALVGRSGDDYLVGGHGDDVLRGGSGTDRLRGDRGFDALIGGAGEDVFAFVLAEPSEPAAGRCDILRAGDGGSGFDGVGLASGDLIGLSRIDANADRAGGQAFAFGGASQGRLSLAEIGDKTLVCGNTDRDAAFEFQLLIEDGPIRAGSYEAEDFIL